MSKLIYGGFIKNYRMIIMNENNSAIPPLGGNSHQLI
jgi:hypothetical protein